MGYRTHFEIEVDPGDEDLEKMRTTICAKEYGYTLGEFLDEEVESIEWYEHGKDLKSFSKRFPSAILTVTGYGEEDGDVWRSYFHMGKCHVADTEIVHESFDKEKLR